jgi:hypothetical protein
MNIPPQRVPCAVQEEGPRRSGRGPPKIPGHQEGGDGYPPGGCPGANSGLPLFKHEVASPWPLDPGFGTRGEDQLKGPGHDPRGKEGGGHGSGEEVPKWPRGP